MEDRKQLKKPLLFEKETYAIVGAAIEVHRQLGPGFLEAVYQECLAREFSSRGIPYVPEREIPIAYKGVPLKSTYRADFLCFDKIIVEIKAIKRLGGIHEAQLLNYLKATGLRVGYLLNFGSHPTLERKRMAL